MALSKTTLVKIADLVAVHARDNADLEADRDTAEWVAAYEATVSSTVDELTGDRYAMIAAGYDVPRQLSHSDAAIILTVLGV